MKKIILAVICVIVSLSAVADDRNGIQRSYSEESFFIPTPKPERSWHHSGLFFNAGVGVLAGGEYCDPGLGYEIGWGYRWHIGAGVSWEVFRLGANMDLLNFVNTCNFRLTTGVRYDTPRFDFMKKMSMYANFVCGAGYVPEQEQGGFVYEIGAGVKLMRRFSVGLVWQNNPKIKYYYTDYDFDNEWRELDVPLNWGMFGVKIEYQFR